MKLSRITDMVAALLLVMSLQTFATLPVVTALSMGSRQCALEKIGEMQNYLACVLGMTGPVQNMAKGRKCIRLPRLQEEAEDDADAQVCPPLVGFSTYDDISKLCVSGMEEWQCSDLTTSFLNFVSSGEES